MSKDYMIIILTKLQIILNFPIRLQNKNKKQNETKNTNVSS